MFKNSRLFIGLSFSVFAGLLVGPQERALSQEAAAGVLEEIIVTARRRDESLMDTPVSITAFTTAELDARQIDQVHQIAESTPGLVFINAGGTGASLGATMYIRGVGQKDLLPIIQPGVGLYIDGAYIAQTSGGLANVVDIESIEVLRGPQGTLFGRNTIGGAILINSVKPNDELEGDIDITLGDFSRQQVKGTVNVPFSDNFFGRFTLMKRDKDGYIDTINIAGDDGLGSDDTTSGRVALRWLSDSVTVDWNADFTNHESDGQPYVLSSMINEFLDGTEAATNNELTIRTQGGRQMLNADAFFPLDAYKNAADFYAPTDWDIFGTSLQVEWQVSDNLTFNSVTTYRDTDGTGGNDNDQSPANVFHSYNFYESDQFTQEFRLSGTAVDDRLQWTGGLYWFQEQAFNIDDVDFPFFEARSGSYVDNTSFAAFGQFSYDVSDRVSITLGARYTDEQLNDIVDDRVQFATALFNPGVTTPPDNVVLPDGYVFPVIAGYDYFAIPPAAGSFKIVPNQNFESDYDDVNPYFSIAYDFTDALMGYVSYSEGFKGGGFTQRIGPGNEVNAFLPEFAQVYEVGAKWSTDRVRLTGALFFNDYTELQVSTDRQIGGTVENAADAEIKGGELELLAALTDQLQFVLGLGYLDGEYVELNPNVAFPPANDLPNVMDWQRNASIIYSTPVTSGEITARVDYSFASGHVVEADNIPEAYVDDYSIVNVALAYIHESDKWEIALQGRNVGDKVYFLDSASTPDGDGWTEGLLQPPAEYSLRLRYRF